MANDIEISVVLPAYKEEENLSILLPEIKKVVSELTPSYEILVVDTLLPLDDTALVCAKHGIKYVNRRDSNLFGDAVRTGIDEAKGRFIIFMDADGSHPPGFITKLFEFGNANDVVVASRYVDGGRTENSRPLAIMSRILNLVYSIVLGIPCRDISNSFKIYRSDLLKEVKLYSDNFDIVEEMLYKMVRRHRNLRIKEVPFTFEKRKFGETKRNLPRFILSFLFTLMKLRFGK